MRAAVARLRAGWSWLTVSWSDYLELTKPRIAVLVLVVVLVAGLINPASTPMLAIHAVIGTALVAAASSVFNQLSEQQSDALMRRTRRRPLPAGRLSATEATIFGVMMAVLGVCYLIITCPPLTTLLAIVSLVIYVWLYTPMKRTSPLNTVVGAVAGAMPALIGGSVHTGSISPATWAVFAVLLLWQFPHFFAIAWIYRDEYAAAGLKMLPTTPLGRQLCGPISIAYASVLLAVSLTPALVGLTKGVYFGGALVLGVQFLAYTCYFGLAPSDRSARSLLWASLIYLPALLLLLIIDLK